jgi:hypothetical protein
VTIRGFAASSPVGPVQGVRDGGPNTCWTRLNGLRVSLTVSAINSEWDSSLAGPFLAASRVMTRKAAATIERVIAGTTPDTDGPRCCPRRGQATPADRPQGACPVLRLDRHRAHRQRRAESTVVAAGSPTSSPTAAAPCRAWSSAGWWGIRRRPTVRGWSTWAVPQW